MSKLKRLARALSVSALAASLLAVGFTSSPSHSANIAVDASSRRSVSQLQDAVTIASVAYVEVNRHGEPAMAPQEVGQARSIVVQRVTSPLKTKATWQLFPDKKPVDVTIYFYTRTVRVKDKNVVQTRLFKVRATSHNIGIKQIDISDGVNGVYRTYRKIRTNPKDPSNILYTTKSMVVEGALKKTRWATGGHRVVVKIISTGQGNAVANRLVRKG